MAKLNNGTLFRMMTYFAAILFTAGCVYGAVHYRLNTVEGNVKSIEDKDIPNLEKDIDSCDKMATENKMELIGVKKDIGSLAEKVDRNYTVQQQILDEIKELH